MLKIFKWSLPCPLQEFPSWMSSSLILGGGWFCLSRVRAKVLINEGLLSRGTAGPPHNALISQTSEYSLKTSLWFRLAETFKKNDERASYLKCLSVPYSVAVEANDLTFSVGIRELEYFLTLVNRWEEDVSHSVILLSSLTLSLVWPIQMGQTGRI